MITTNELRFVEREVPAHMDGANVVTKTIRILQQKWEGNVYADTDYSKVYGRHSIEWRDVPCVKED